MSRKPIKLLVTDLDNTLYDWVTFFSRSFYAMVDVAVDVLEVPREQLLDELKEVHQRYHNSEQPFALLETRTAVRAFGDIPRAELAARLDAAFHAFNASRKDLLKAYSGVQTMLASVVDAHCVVVGHTEATVPNAQFRLAKLELADYFDALYAVAHDGPAHPNGGGTVKAGVSQVRNLRQDERKPNPEVLFDICRDYGVAPAMTLYVGDSLSRDIGMANAAGVCSAHAAYGRSFTDADWQGLVRVTHWTKEDINRAEAAAKLYGHALPDVTLTRFDEIAEHYEFVPTDSQLSAQNVKTLLRPHE